ncbi:EF-hand calcium-binding domain-containing protein 14 [Holothuria leucospilota]|uniref:EF-hand calcium-binding domain-containing protein 14 n=1 Tax=Holothuria leucospilota TaxID=206669 RepID=A0A9Q1C8V8_HOLLE|nr:EF-hand calcium-binding domain-containing protein 14 [Holothuria leucospilota]
MKKRKELDALLMNGKKSRTKRSKDGHELLQNMDSDSNSSDLDEFIMQPRKHTIVRRKIDLCSVCLHLLAFILVVTCISICIGVVWMNFQLKNDLDKLTQKVADVESSLSRSQGSPLDKNQEEALKMIPSLVTNIGLLNDSLNTLNKSVGTLKVNLTKLEAKVEQYTAFMAEKEADFKSLQQKLENLETSVDNLKTDIATLKEKPSQQPTQSPSKVTSPAGTRTEPLSDSSGALLSVRQSLQTLNDSVSKLNQTVLELAAEVSKQHDDTIPAGDSTEELLQKLQQNVTYLMEVVQKELSADDDSTDAPSGTSSGGGTIPPAANITSWQHLMENRIDDSVGITPVRLQELTSETPKIQSVDTGITSPSVENEVTTSALNIASANSSIKTGEAVKTTKPSQEGIPTPVQAVTTESGEGASIGTGTTENGPR